MCYIWKGATHCSYHSPIPFIEKYKPSLSELHAVIWQYELWNLKYFLAANFLLISLFFSKIYLAFIGVKLSHLCFVLPI